VSKAKITRQATVQLEFAGFEVAQMFWDLDGDHQAHFFDELARLAGPRFAFQMQFVTDSEQLSDGGRHIMDTIGNYAQKAKP